MVRSFQQIAAQALIKVAEECGCDTTCDKCGNKDCTCEDEKINKVDAAIAPVSESKKEASRIADMVLKKISTDSLGGAPAASGTSSGGGGGTMPKGPSMPSIGGMPPAPGQMGAAQPKRLDPLQKQN